MDVLAQFDQVALARQSLLSEVLLEEAPRHQALCVVQVPHQLSRLLADQCWHLIQVLFSDLVEQQRQQEKLDRWWIQERTRAVGELIEYLVCQCDPGGRQRDLLLIRTWGRLVFAEREKLSIESLAKYLEHVDHVTIALDVCLPENGCDLRLQVVQTHRCLRLLLRRVRTLQGRLNLQRGRRFDASPGQPLII